MRVRRDKPLQIVIILEGTIKVNREKIFGILKYGRIHGPWRVHLMEGRPDEQILREFSEWGATGMISDASMTGYSTYFHDAIIKAKLPTVILDPHESLLRPEHPFSKFSVVSNDGKAVGRMGADHFLERKLQHFAFVDDVACSNWSVFRREAFADRLAEEGYSCRVYEPLSDNEKIDWGVEHKRMIRWLQSLPKPVGIMAAMDARGRQILDACFMAKIDVPHEICVLGVDNDEIICDTTTPPMSSVMNDNENGGYLAAKILDGLMQHRTRKRQVVCYRPLHVVSRRSTEVVFIRNKLVIDALEYIRFNAGLNLQVMDIARHLGVSRRLLELNFKESLNTTIISEIQRFRFEYIKRLLLESNMSITEITRLCGLGDESHLAAAFKKKFGITMTQFRKRQ